MGDLPVKDRFRKHLPKTGFTSLVLVALVGLLALLALAACSRTTARANVTPSPSAAAILQQASQASYKDVTFALTFTMTTQGQTVTGTGSGKATTHPVRVDELLSFPLVVSGKTLQVTAESIIDVATNAAYVKYTGIPGHTTRWTKVSLSAVAASMGIDYSSLTSFNSLQNARVIGAETIDGVAVWHIRADFGATSTPTTSTPAAKASTPTATATPAVTTTADVYIRQDNSYPVKETAHTSGSTPIDMTVTFTKYDSGLSITLPKV